MEMFSPGSPGQIRFQKTVFESFKRESTTGRIFPSLKFWLPGPGPRIFPCRVPRNSGFKILKSRWRAGSRASFQILPGYGSRNPARADSWLDPPPRDPAKPVSSRNTVLNLIKMFINSNFKSFKISTEQNNAFRDCRLHQAYCHYSIPPDLRPFGPEIPVSIKFSCWRSILRT